MELILTNKDGKTLDLLYNPNYFVLSKCEALHGVETDISTVDIPNQDGAVIENVKALPRGIQLTFKLIPDIRQSIDFFTNVVKSKQFVTLTETEGNRTIIIKGIATIPPYTRMMDLCEITLEIYCGQPYWEDLTQVVSDISMYIDLLWFPLDTGGKYFPSEGVPFGEIDADLTKTFINDGDCQTGMLITINALGSVQNPRISCDSGSQQGNWMQLNLTLQTNDEVVINTNNGQKTILINNSDTYNGLPTISYLTFKGQNWLQLETGENVFNVGEFINNQLVLNQTIHFTISYKRKYE